MCSRTVEGIYDLHTTMGIPPPTLAPTSNLTLISITFNCQYLPKLLSVSFFHMLEESFYHSNRGQVLWVLSQPPSPLLIPVKRKQKENRRNDKTGTGISPAKPQGLFILLRHPTQIWNRSVVTLHST